MLRMYAEIFNFSTKTSLSTVWPNILFEMLQPSGAWQNNQLFGYETVYYSLFICHANINREYNKEPDKKTIWKKTACD